MPGERFVVLGLAPPRSRWFSLLSQWATSGAVPVEFVKCVSAEEVRAHLGSGRPFSAALVDTSVVAFDADLVDAGLRVGCPIIAIGAPSGAALAATAVLDPDLDPQALLDALAQHCQPIGRADTIPGDDQEAPSGPWRGRVVAVAGPGGTGASTVAIAAAQGLVADTRFGGQVLLADLALRAEQAMLHDARDIVPGLQELVEAHRTGNPSPEEVRALTFAVAERGYHLMLGLRRARAWSAVRPRAFAAAFDSLRRAHRVVVCDCDGDFEGEREGGSLDVEERNTMSREAALQADVVLAVGRDGLKGLHSLARLLGDLFVLGANPARVVPVINMGPRSPRQRAEVVATLAQLLPRQQPAMASPIFLPERKVDDAFVDGVRLHPSLVIPLVGAINGVFDRQPLTPALAPERVAPGSLGTMSRMGGASEAASG